ncbi:hypothetical protein [Spongiactinospora sp. TRM90649]|uniref:hypothetical protein n=1 Tax=Spongiactinospora sp. TRM90649 TaxID=3031114 RepID=UPI0023F75413|nr:hypothetical protein [Spongiactinospora sp. TRM90649]MDF5755832.1 hypothetical protein [Spongiactinospora sp. TRM90649]
MAGPDVVTIADLTVAVAERTVETVSVGYTQITSEGSHSHTAGQVGADPAGTATAAVSAHTAASDPHPGYLTQTEADARYAALGASGAVFPLSGYGLTAASGDPLTFLAAAQVSSGQVILTRCWIPANTAVTNVWCAVREGGTYSTSAVPNRLGVYDDDGVQVAVTADDSTLWSANGWRGGALVGGAVSAQAAGRFVYLGAIWGGFSGVAIPFPSSASDSQVPWFSTGVGVSKRRAMYSTGQSGLPASFNPASFGIATTFFPLIGVS